MLSDLFDLSRALSRDEMVPYFQPIVELRNGHITGFELLARWDHPEHGPILPANFIALAEEHGLIEVLTEQVFRKAFLVAKTLPENVNLSVNISPLQLLNRGLPHLIASLAAETGFQTRKLKVEITETALLSELQQVLYVASDLKALGCRLSLDDFGTGYSSLRHLQALPFDELKIDRSFVAEMTRKRESRKIVAAIVGLGHSLGLSTVAEGVETEEQAHMLMWLVCDMGQGWRYGHVCPAADLPAMLAAPPRPTIPGLATPGDDWASSSLQALPTLRLAHLQAIYDGAPVGLAFLDLKLRYVSINRRLSEMNGLPIDAHLGRKVEELFPRWYPHFEPYLRRALAGEAISGVKIIRPALHPGHPDLVLLASYQPAWDEADEVIGVSVSLLDVTPAPVEAGTQLDGTLPESRISEVNTELPWVMDAEGNNLQGSARWIQTTPLGKDRTRNLRWLEALHPEDLERAVKIMKEALQTGKPIDFEYRIQGIDSEWRWMRSTGLPRYGPNGEITRWYGSVEDIHDRKQLEEPPRQSS